MARTADMKDFELGQPALVCRWRLAGGTLPLENRHLRALSRRVVNGQPLPTSLVAWVKQHVEWTLSSGSAEHPDGVLMTLVDEQNHAAMTVGPYEPLAHTTVSALADRARDAAREAAKTGVAPETLWVVHEGRLLIGEEAIQPPAGVTSLLKHLAETLGIAMQYDDDLIREVFSGRIKVSGGVFLASDEHGVVVASDASSPRAKRLAGAYQQLLEKARKHRS